MNKSLKALFWGGVAAAFLSFGAGCAKQTNADADFEKQIRAPKGPPPPEAAKAMEQIRAAEERGRKNGVR